MADIRRHPLVSHLRSETTMHTLRYAKGALKTSSPGASFWFRPLHTALAEVPLADQDAPLHTRGRTADFQEVHVSGAVTFAVDDPERLSGRIDFGIDADGQWINGPLDRLQTLLGGLADQHVNAFVAARVLTALLSDGGEALRTHLSSALHAEGSLAEMGLRVVAVRIGQIAPGADLERALQTPAREQLQRAADAAQFARRAEAVEHERAIAENEMANRIAIAARERELVETEGENTRRRVTEAAAAGRIEAEGRAVRAGVDATAEADGVTVLAVAEAERIRVVEHERAVAESERVGAYATLTSEAISALAALALAHKVDRLDHVSLGGDGLGSALRRLFDAQADEHGGR